MDRYQTPNSMAPKSPVELCDILEVQVMYSQCQVVSNDA